MTNFLRTYDGLYAGVIFAFWFGRFPEMSTNRILALNAIFQRTGMPVCLIHDSNFSDWEHPDYPFHPALQYLSAVHKSDYLRAYFMHYYGGGYTDIKQPQRSWAGFFSSLIDSSKWALGYPELSPTGTAELPGDFGQEIRNNYQSIIGMCSYIMRKNTPLTGLYLDSIENILSRKLETLSKHPAQNAFENLMKNSDGTSEYPLRWTEIGGECLHPLVYLYRNSVLYEPNICPILYGYR